MLATAEVAADRQQALESLESALHRGSLLAADQLAFVYTTGALGVAPDIDFGTAMYERAIAQELPGALLEYGLLLYHGYRVPADIERGKALIVRAAQLGDAIARAFLIGLLEEAGDDASLARADAWRNALGRNDDSLRGGTAGDPEYGADRLAQGQVALSILYRTGTIVPPDPERAAGWSARPDPSHRGLGTAWAAIRYSWSQDVRVDQRLARELYAQVIEDAGPETINNYAWLLATSIVDDVRDGATAVQLMEALLEVNERAPAWVDTLAAAYAEAGDFEAAVETQEEVLSMIDEGSAANGSFVERRDLYAEGVPWRD